MSTTQFLVLWSVRGRQIWTAAGFYVSKEVAEAKALVGRTEQKSFEYIVVPVEVPVLTEVAA